MNYRHRFMTTNLQHFPLKIFSSGIKNKEIQLIIKALKRTYGNTIDTILGGELELINEAYSFRRGQYSAEILLKYLLKTKIEGTVLWVIQKDLYCTGLNFVFGYAMYKNGAIVSTYRLPSIELKEKEAIHEVGHILGLQHCNNQCVMHFSNSLLEAKEKPVYLCESCKKKIFLLQDSV